MQRHGAASQEITLAQLLATFAFAGDIATGLEFDDGVRACFLAHSIAEEMGLSQEEQLTVYYTALLKDLGCTCWSTEEAQFWQTDEIIARRELLFFGAGSTLPSYFRWMRRHVGAGQPLLSRMGALLAVLRESGPFLNEGYASAAEVCVRITRRLGLPQSVQAAAACLTEQWDGKGEPRGLKGTDIPIAARVVMPTYLLVPIHQVAGREASREVAGKGRGKAFDPDAVDAFLRLTEGDSFWSEFESPDIFDLTLAREPESALAHVGSGKLETVVSALADFIDLKSPSTAAHSRRVAALTTEIARLMQCGDEDISRYRLAALLHDIGSVAVPSHILNREASSLTPSEREAERLHPYHGERILERIPAMAPFIPLVGNHHEHMDGSGYFRGLKGSDIPLGARVIAVANRLDELTHESRADIEPAEALRRLEAEGSEVYDPTILRAVKACFPGGPASATTKRDRPAGLTDREVDVLRMAARALTRKQIGEALSISEATVRHHLEHIYAKTGTSTRVGATLFAMENDLIE